MHTNDLYDSVQTKLMVVFTAGLVIRLILMPYTSTASIWARVTGFDNLFIGGLNPLALQGVHGSSFWLFGLPFYSLYTLLSSLGLHYSFLLDFLMKMPSLLGDIIIFYAIYRITYLIFADGRKSLLAASVYFLNPYTIWMAGIIGPGEQLMSGFLLLSILFMMENRGMLSATCLAFATFFRYIPILFLPVFIIYLWRNRGSYQSLRFLGAFIGISFFMIIPYIPNIVSLYNVSSSALMGHIQNFIGPTEIGLVPYARTVLTYFDITYFEYNFTGILASLGYSDTLALIFNFRTFLIFSIFTGVVLLRRKSSSTQQINRVVVVTFSLFLLLTPLLQHHYLLWLFPFIILSSYVFRDLPRYFPIILSTAFILIDPILPLSVTGYFDNTFPGMLDSIIGLFTFENKFTALAISMLTGLLLVLIIVNNIIHSISSKPGIEDIYSSLSRRFTSRDWFLVIFLLLYGIFEMYYVTNFFTPYLSKISPFGFMIGFYLIWKIWRDRSLGFNPSLEGRSIFVGVSLLWAYVFLISLSLFTVSLVIITSTIPIFLLIEITMLSIFWINYRISIFGLMMQRIVFIFTPIYIGFSLLITGNPYPTLIALPLLISWIYLQIKLDNTNLKLDDSHKNRYRPKEWFLHKKLNNAKIKLILSNHNNKRFLVVVAIAVIGLIYSPLLIASINGTIPNERSFFILPPAPFPGTSQFQEDENLILGSFGGIDTAQADWISNTWPIPLMSESMKVALPARVVIVGDDPLFLEAPKLITSKVQWFENLSSIQWRVGGGGHIMTFEGSKLDLSANFTKNERGSFLWWAEGDNFIPINSSEYPYVVARWRSTDHIARLVLYTEDQEDFKVIVETPTGVIEYPANDYGGGYSPEWTTTVFKIPANKMITRFDIGLDSGRWTDVEGEQHVEFESIIFAQGTLDAQHVKVALNGNTIFDEESTIKIMGDFYTVGQNSFDYVSGDLFIQNEQLERLKNFEIQINGSTLTAENTITITLDNNGIWKISQVLIVLDITSESIIDPSWQSMVPYLWVILLMSTVIGFWATRQFYGWFKMIS